MSTRCKACDNNLDTDDDELCSMCLRHSRQEDDVVVHLEVGDDKLTYLIDDEDCDEDVYCN
jgi:recombinational DNA repair protein RecR